MKLRYICFIFIFNYINLADYEYNHYITSLVDNGQQFYSRWRKTSGKFLYYTSSCVKINYPARNFSGFYLIFDYHIHKERGDDFNIKIFDKTFSGRRNKIVLKINTTSEFTIYINFGSSFDTYDLYVNYLTGYSDYPYFLYYYWSLQYNLSTEYCINDEFRMIMNLTNFPKDKKHYFYQTFSFKDKPAYKLFESYESALNFNFVDYDGYLDIDDSKAFIIKKTNDKYNYMILYFKGKEEYEDYGPELYEQKFVYLENYEIFTFYPVIPFAWAFACYLIITTFFYILFQYEKKSKKINEPEVPKREIEQELVNKQ